MDRTTCPRCQTRRSSWKAGETPEMWLETHNANAHADLERGSGLTEFLYTDTSGYVVASVNAKNTTATVYLLDAVDASTGHQPARMEGPWPVWSHDYTDEERTAALEAAEAKGFAPQTIRRRRDGRWYLAGATTPLNTRGAHYHRDYSY